LTDSGRFTHKVVKQPSISLAQDRESSPAMTDVLTTMLHHQLWAPTAGLLQNFTAMQQCLHQMTFRNVCEVKKRMVQPGLV